MSVTKYRFQPVARRRQPITSVGDLIRRLWVQTPPRSNFLWPVGTPKLPLSGNNQGGFAVSEEMHGLLPAPKHLFKKL